MTSAKNIAVSRQQRIEFEAWLKNKPQCPGEPRPIKKQVPAPSATGTILMFIGGITGVGLVAIGVTMWNVSGSVASLLLLAATIFMGLILPVGITLVIDAVYSQRYGREMQRTGWATYEVMLAEWRQEGKDTFPTIAEEDFLLGLRLKLQLEFD